MQVLTVPAVAELLDCTPDTVRELAREGTLPGFKPGRDWVFPQGALMARLDEIALEHASKRRQPTKPSATLHKVPTDGRKARRAPPQLPALG
jgi:excisionase family DNA binding protein